MSVPERVTVRCPDCCGEIPCDPDVAPMPGTAGARFIDRAPSLADLLAQHYLDTHDCDATGVNVKVPTLQSN